MEHIWIDSDSAYSASAKVDLVGDTSARVGSAFFLDLGVVMYFSTPFLMVEMTVSQPPCTPTAKL
eukprot:scaffold4918_cov46-Cyclotella_meneghiniana.AAC.2